MAWCIGYAAALCFGISFIGSGTGSSADQIKWSRRFGIAGVLLALIAVATAVL